ncbi:MULTISPECIES: CDP-glycerol glycerophosphotransferase family protein [Bacillaceae]|uniref:CDP-glycerol glycerophosphotransferase family protein n=1 Tax=Evansella alkalicola TaxID=745819 RepID=A0ABS6JXZ2_9BACI|nr:MULTISPECIES: CDP-glycerol glycerophosphotransferase family protein [Bacillaceae]MBU9723454.1 CDP-glycerol glycerophosphotransferase family protein [Bacillus alkalicola]
MDHKIRTIWFFSIEFLFTFKLLQYNKISLPLLLLRDFQKFLNKQNMTKYNTDFSFNSKIQDACRPYLITSNPDHHVDGNILIRSELYPITKGIKNKSFIYLAHHKREYQTMLKVKECRPLIYLPKLGESYIPTEEERLVFTHLEHIVSANSTPDYFKTNTFIEWMKKRLQRLLKRIRQVQTLFEQYPIKLTVYGSTINRHGCLVTSFAQNRKILTVNIQHGIFGELAHLPVNADVNIVWGESHRQYLISHGAPKNKIKVAAPLFFRSSNTNSKNRKYTKKRSHYDLNLLVALQPLGYVYNKKLIKKIERAISNIPYNIKVTYKLHPDQRKKKMYKKLLLQRGSAIVAHGKKPLREMIIQSNLIITPYSSVAYEALILEKPVVFYGTVPPLYYLKKQPRPLRSSKQIKKMILQSIKNPTFLKSLQRKFVLNGIDSQKEITNKELWRLIN